MPPLFWIKYAVKLLVLPPFAPLLLALVGLGIAGRHPRAGRRVALAGIVALWVLATPAVADFLVRLLDRSPPLDVASAANAQAIVVLGGGTRFYAPEYGGATVSPITLERVRYGAYLARRTKLPVLVSGGPTQGAPPEAILMRNVLVHEFGVPVRWTETHARNTHENAVDSAKMLAAAGVHRIVLVGNSFDFPRSRKEFEAQGLYVMAAPIGLPLPIPTRLTDFLPSPGGLQLSYYAIYEMLANVLFDITPHAAQSAASSS
ncbi:MAG TPA: YdcF family protein [Casimicrobiaceae bacterium]|nr:YdcF family protein [Casimicrobiaceae bacterium]